MINYKVISNKNEFCVLETQTNLIINKFNNNKDARNLVRHLNFGGGFDGFTPTFFLVETLSYINKKQKHVSDFDQITEA